MTLYLQPLHNEQITITPGDRMAYRKGKMNRSQASLITGSIVV
jgi:hypothetical protein